MSRGEDDVVDDVVGLQLRAADTATTAALRLEAVGRDCLHVLRLGHDDDQFFVFDQIEVGHLAIVETDLADARRCEFFLDRCHLRPDDFVANRRVGEDRFELDDSGAHVDDLLLDVDPAEPGELAQTHFEDVLGLHLAELERWCQQTGLGFCRILAAADEGDDLIDDVECLQPAFEDVLAIAGLASAGTVNGG